MGLSWFVRMWKLFSWDLAFFEFIHSFTYLLTYLLPLSYLNSTQLNSLCNHDKKREYRAERIQKS